MDLHLLFAWSWILLGLCTGALLGLFFAGDDWLGGYGSWPRRMVRLGHVSLVGTGLLNLAGYWTLQQITVTVGTATLARWLLVAGAVLMPTCCFAAALRRPLRHAFVAPVIALAAGSGTLVNALAHGA